MNNSSHTSDTTRLYLKQAILQSTAALAVLCVVVPYSKQLQSTFPWYEASLMIGVVAFLLACLSRQYWWWKAIHLLFAPSAYLSSQLNIAPKWYLAASIVLFLVFRGAISGRVPLYCSSKKTAQTLSELFAHNQPAKLIDVGAGTGNLVAPLAHSLTETMISGIENSILPWFVGYVRCKRLSNCEWFLGDFWKIHLASFDVVYAFLSPEPMNRLWRKANEEMRPGSLFISNSFPVPDINITFVIDVDDFRQTRLYCYRIGQASIEADTSPRHHHHGLGST